MPCSEPPRMFDNAALLARAQEGDSEAFCFLMEAEEARLYRQALVLTGNASSAEDLVVETMTGAWQGLARFDGGCRLSTWLHAILLHRFQKHLRRIRSRPPSAAMLNGVELGKADAALGGLTDGGLTAVEVAVQDESAARMRRAMATLPEDHRTVLLLRFFDGASLSEISAALGIPLGTVKSRLHHGLGKLRGLEEVVNLWDERRDS